MISEYFDLHSLSIDPERASDASKASSANIQLRTEPTSSWSVLGPFSRAIEGNLLSIELTSLTTSFLPFTKNHGDVVAVSRHHCPWFLPLIRASPTLSFEPLSFLQISSVIAASPAHEASLRNQDWAGDTSKHHHCRRCLVIWLLGSGYSLFRQPLDLRLLRDCSGHHRLLVPLFCSPLTTRATMLSIDPTNELAETGFPPPRPATPRCLPLVVSFPWSSKFLNLTTPPARMNCVDSGDFAAACAFFINNGHVVVFHDCPDTISFQALYPSGTIGYITSLPAGLLARESLSRGSSHSTTIASHTVPTRVVPVGRHPLCPPDPVIGRWDLISLSSTREA